MLALTYSRANDLNQLHDELISAGTIVANVDASGAAVCMVTGADDGDEIVIYVPDETTQAEQDSISAVVAAHTPNPKRALAYQALVALRNERLVATDPTQLPDFPLPAGTSSSDWATYREALRQLPDTTADAASWVWPEPPGGAKMLQGVQLI